MLSGKQSEAPTHPRPTHAISRASHRLVSQGRLPHPACQPCIETASALASISSSSSLLLGASPRRVAATWPLGCVGTSCPPRTPCPTLAAPPGTGPLRWLCRVGAGGEWAAGNRRLNPSPVGGVAWVGGGLAAAGGEAGREGDAGEGGWFGPGGGGAPATVLAEAAGVAGARAWARPLDGERGAAGAAPPEAGSLLCGGRGRGAGTGAVRRRGAS